MLLRIVSLSVLFFPVLAFAEGVSPAASMVMATPALVPANGTSMLMVNLLDSSSRPVAGKSVSLSSSNGAGDLIVPTSSTLDANGNPVSDSNGMVTFIVASDLSSATYTATDVTDTITIAQTATVSYTLAPQADPNQSLVIANPMSVPANGMATVIVTLLDPTGSGISGKSIRLFSSNGPSDLVKATSSPVDSQGNPITAANGQVSFVVSSSQPGATFTATDVTDNLMLNQMAPIGFNLPSQTGSIQYTVTANPSATNQDDCTIATVTLVNTVTANPVAGESISLASSNLNDLIIGTADTFDSSGNPTTDSQGEAAFTVCSYQPGATLTATDVTAGYHIPQTASVAFNAGPPDPDPTQSTVVATPTTVTDPNGTSTVTVTLRDATGTVPISGVSVQLSSSNLSADTITPTSSPLDSDGNPITGSNGQVTFSVFSPYGSATYEATELALGNAIAALATVTFAAKPPPPAPVAAKPCNGANGVGQLRAVGGFSNTSAFAVGDNGAICVWDGRAWTIDPFSGKTSEILLSVWMDSNGLSEGWAGGTNPSGGFGTLLHYVGGGWSDVSGENWAQIPNTIRRIFGVDAGHVWLTSDRGGTGSDVYSYDRAKWARVYQSPKCGLSPIWAASTTEVWTGGEKGCLVHYSGGKWTVERSNTSHLYGIFGTSNKDVWAGGGSRVGTPSLIQNAYDGKGWKLIKNASASPFHFWSVYRPGGSDPVFALYNKGIMVYQGGKWVSMPIPALGKGWLNWIWGTSKTNIWAVGKAGDGGAVILNYNGVKWSKQN